MSGRSCGASTAPTCRRSRRRDVYISVRNWRQFQHYDPAKRVPPWIKNHTELMANDDYLRLSEHRVTMLHRLWLEYASSLCRLSADTRSLSRRLFVRVTTADIDALVQAGFITLVASAELADGYQAASSRARSREEEEEVDEDIPLPPSSKRPKTKPARNGRAGDAASYQRAEQLIRNGAYQLTDASLEDELTERDVPPGARETLLELARSLRP